ncbi:MAG: prolyl oligopeptidase family serine peptidase [Rhodanobacteraceae bacterium]
MRHQRRLQVAACLLLGLIVLPAFARSDAVLAHAKQAAEAAPRAPDVPRGLFMRKPDVRGITMSPDGAWLGYRQVTDRGLALRVRNLASGESRRVMADSTAATVYWSGDGARLWLVDADGVGVYDMATQSGRRIVRFDTERKQSFWGVDANAPDYAVLREKVPVDGQWVFRYLAVDVRGRTRLIDQEDSPLRAVLLNADATPRYLAGYDGDQFDTVIWRVVKGHKQAIMRCPLPQQCRPVAYRGGMLWALAHHGSDLMSLQRYSVDSGKWTTVDSDPRGISDAIGVLMQPDGKDWLATAYRPDRVEWHGRTRQARATLAALQAQMPDASLDLQASKDGNRWLVRASRSNWQYDRYFLFAPKDKTLTALFADARKPHVPADEMAGMVPLHWRNKHGVQLHGYAYLPMGVPLRKAPIMTLVHGGPYNRSDGGMDVGTQLMVNRGYVVFKPNFRASTGYGIKYATGTGGNFGKHGGALDDIVSGIDYLLAHGVGDRKQQAIVGHSFGGYASLLAVTCYPHRFAFAVPSAAPVDFAWVMEDIAVEGGSALPIDGPPVEVLLPRYGVPYADKAWHERMHHASPLAHVANLKTPLYLWAGAKDDRVAVESLVRYVARANPEHRPTLLIDPDSGHSPHQRLNSEALAWLIEAAANRYFGGGLTPASAQLQTFLDKNLRQGEGAPLP